MGITRYLSHQQPYVDFGHSTIVNMQASQRRLAQGKSLNDASTPVRTMGQRKVGELWQFR